MFNLHKSLGLTVLALAVVRLAWRLYAGAPIPMASIPRWQLLLARVTHWLLYGLIIAMPLSGWLFDSASGLRPLRWFELFQVPKLIAPNTGVREIARDAHGWIFWVLVLLILMHAGAALYHHYFVGDGTLRRMLPGRRMPPPSSNRNS
ncbi:Cytochrome B561 [Lysobacter sp. A03]|nr:Cytochrome B561 [Lysobacter sp. A03]